MSIAEDDFAIKHNFDLFLEEKTTMTNDTTTNVNDKPNGSDVHDSDLVTTAKNIGAGAGAAAAKATDLAHTAQDYGQKLSQAATQAKDFVGEKAVVVKDKIKELSDVDIAELADNAKSYARRNPGQAILISAAAGLLLGLIIRGRR